MTDRQPALFAADRLTHTACPVPGCGAIRTASQTGRVPTCNHDRNQALGQPARRPRGCLSTHDPATAPCPDGY